MKDKDHREEEENRAEKVGSEFLIHFGRCLAPEPSCGNMSNRGISAASLNSLICPGFRKAGTRDYAADLISGDKYAAVFETAKPAKPRPTDRPR